MSDSLQNSKAKKNILFLFQAFESVQFSCSVVSDSLWPHGLKHARLPCPSLTPGACYHSFPSHQWCHPTISCSVIPFSSCLQSYQHQGFFFASGGQSIWTSAFVLQMNIQDWFPFRLTGLISLQSKGLSRVFSNTTVQKHRFLSVQPSLWSSSHTRWTFVHMVMSVFNILTRWVIAFLPRSKHLLFSRLQSPSAVILEPKKIKSLTVSLVSPCICHEVMGLDAMVFVFWMLSFKPGFSLSSFTFIKLLF